MEHELKCWPEHFEPVARGVKTVELRRNDRNYQVGDTLYLREWEPMENAYTGRSVYAVITHIVSGEWLTPGYVALSIRMALGGHSTASMALHYIDHASVEDVRRAIGG